MEGKRVHILAVLGFFACAIWIIVMLATPSTTCRTDVLCLVFLDVGQGDAIYVRSPSGEQALIDGGADGALLLRRLDGVVPGGIQEFAYVFATHPDTDHIGGLEDVLARFNVEHVYTTSVEGDTEVAKSFGEVLARADAESRVVHAGDAFTLGEAIITTLYPTVDMPHADPNNASLILHVQYGSSDFMLTGDAPKLAEYRVENILGSQALDVEVLKLGHHGSDTSSRAAFIEATSPSVGIVSAGEDNSYGHPHDVVVDRFMERGVPLLSTGDNGSIIFETDGKAISVRNKK